MFCPDSIQISLTSLMNFIRAALHGHFIYVCDKIAATSHITFSPCCGDYKVRIIRASPTASNKNHRKRQKPPDQTAFYLDVNKTSEDGNDDNTGYNKHCDEHTILMTYAIRFNLPLHPQDRFQ